ncbi:uncharacterized protein PAC_20014 [Phialocephala subalpina]|uniref:DUF1996 domain-containing protein n=1 Tax=Phialocephala subalpina TaxID=576137 RepID=A0A1L7XYG3_9HELO|nr:uncharacterized protein PAC_20014 [Phialocephala subalpina]
MRWTTLVLALHACNANALLRFSCSQLVTERLDPLVNPGVPESPHLHQVIGGNAFNVSMDPANNLSQIATCTTCTFSEDFSNYWTAVLYFRARNGTFKRVLQKGNAGFETANGGGMTVYYSPQAKGKVTAFKQGFWMLIGDAQARTPAQVAQFRQITYTCLQNANTRSGDVPNEALSSRCWDGVSLDSADHTSHVPYPSSGTFENNGPCPATHPVQIPQLFFETVWDTTKFSDKSLWPEDGSQPFVWSQGDPTGVASHGDYVFGWKGDSLQKAMDANCNINCPQLKTQTIAQGNKCVKSQYIEEEIDAWLPSPPGGMQVTAA